ncbi:hypothetical protein XVE_1619 [Xanthomonas vesicatoria ATCC 35937]|uniref:Uncharacterized protein n=1 Tax=Xanthomonas vesicatoria ATCC 35937 TaxID=925775 RepID=F0BBZ5_9XANT|nr:hypothetical protein XVE_1619 [Xanthomonas vesicatoria ATCC 35937]
MSCVLASRTQRLCKTENASLNPIVQIVLSMRIAARMTASSMTTEALAYLYHYPHPT